MSDYFPLELHLEIIKRLPLNSILQCRRVCKSWNSVITSNNFISAHHKLTKSINENGTQTLLIRYFDTRYKGVKYVIGKDDESFGLQFSNFEFPYASMNRYCRLVGYCDGVACLSDDLFGCMNMVILWNPSIRKSIQLLVPNFELMWPHASVLGFGVSPRNHDPKVVRIVYVTEFSLPQYVKIQDPPLVDIFSLSSGAWRKPLDRNLNRPHKMIQITWSQVCFNGVIHWVAGDTRSDHCLIISFDLVHEVFNEMSLPDTLACKHVSNLSVSTRKGYLAMHEYDMQKETEYCGIWVMKEYGVMESWEKLYVIHLPGVLRKTIGFRMNGDIGFRMNGDMILASKNDELVSVECTGNIRNLNVNANISSFFLGSYMESLILLNQPNRKMYILHGDDKIDAKFESGGLREICMNHLKRVYKFS